ncbi:MAG: HAD hydrolase family protein [Clostridiales bacterium]|nr:HAD hydrolase family protein [Clostridiales bacterium]
MPSKFSNILILSDIDGTFLGNRTRIIERNLTAIEHFKSHGGLFTFNTGRTYDNLFTVVPNAAELANAPAALSNGCCLYDLAAGRSIIDYFMPPEPALAVAKYIKANIKDVGMRISAKAGFLADPEDTLAIENLKALKVTKVTYAPIDTWTSENWYKVGLVGKPERLDEVRDELRAVFGNIFTYVKSSLQLLEVYRPDRSKAAMIDTYRAYYRDRKLKIYAVGDYENDYEMLRAADVAACPSNAIDIIKEICDIKLCSNDKGAIADLIGLIAAAG